jgi:putative ABC transport system permease protein
MTLTILGRDIKAKVANIREVEWTNFTINFAITFSPNVLESAPYSSLATVIAPQDIEAEFQRAIAQKFPNVSMVNVTEAVDLIQKILGQMVNAIRFMALLALFTGILVLISAIQSTKLERQYEITILKLLGLNKQSLQKIVTIEFAILGFLSAAMASLLSIAISWAIIVKMMDLTWKIYPLLSFGLVLITVFFTCSLGLFLLRHILRQKSIDVLRNE